MNAEIDKKADISRAIELVSRTLNTIRAKPRREKIFCILANADKPLTFNEIHTIARISTGSLHNLLQTLIFYGILRKDDGWPAKYTLTEFAAEFTKQAALIAEKY